MTMSYTTSNESEMRNHDVQMEVNTLDNSNIRCKKVSRTNIISSAPRRIQHKRLNRNVNGPRIMFCVAFLCTFHNLTGRAFVNAFMSPSAIAMNHNIMSLQQQLPHKRKLSSSMAKLGMVGTKSGGKPIVTVEQFQTEVLLQTEDSDGNTIIDEKEQNPILVLYSAPWYVCKRFHFFKLDNI